MQFSHPISGHMLLRNPKTNHMSVSFFSVLLFYFLALFTLTAIVNDT